MTEWWTARLYKGIRCLWEYKMYANWKKWVNEWCNYVREEPCSQKAWWMKDWCGKTQGGTTGYVVAVPLKYSSSFSKKALAQRLCENLVLPMEVGVGTHWEGWPTSGEELLQSASWYLGTTLGHPPQWKSEHVSEVEVLGQSCLF